MAKKASKEKKTKKTKNTKPVKATKVAKASKPSKPVRPAKPTKSTDLAKSLSSKSENKGSISKKIPTKVEMAKSGKVKSDKPVRTVIEPAANLKANGNSKNLQILVEKPEKLDTKTSKSSLLKVAPQVEEKPVEKKTEGKKKASKLEIDQNTKWSDLYEKFKAIKPVVYNMREIFEANQPVQHKVLGWGWILSNENDRLEVLFKDGKKILISNYKG